MDTFKATVRYVVLAFVMLGAVITLAGLDTDLAGNKTNSADKQTPNKDYAKSEQDRLSAEVGSTG